MKNIASKIIYIRLDVDLIELLDKEARKNRTNRTTIIKQLILKNLCRRDKERREDQKKIKKCRRKKERRKIY